MKVLVIPDVHLKPLMFERASALMNERGVDCAVCLMDLPDDWNRQFQIQLYEQTFDAAAAFAGDWPGSKWCYGNHDLSYPWGMLETGYSPYAERTVIDRLYRMQDTLGSRLAYVHRIDNVLFSHGGVLNRFVRRHLDRSRLTDAGYVVDALNRLEPRLMWNDDSPLWARPQQTPGALYAADTLLQVVGHTPVTRITRSGNLLSCDVFSTRSDATPIGTREFLLLDTLTWEWEGLR